MRATVGVFVLAIAIASCGNMGGGGGTGGTGGGSGGTPDYTSGTRIKARVLSSTDGAKAFAGFYDSMLAMPCSFGHAADDSVRCLPTNVAYTTLWADSGCTIPLAYTVPGCSVTYAQKTETTNSCVDVGYYSVSTRTRIFSVAAPYTGAMIWTGVPGSCNMTTTPAAYSLFTVGAEVPASNFAAGSVDIAP